MSATASYPAEGDQIGPFLVVRRIGGGGMGAVFEAVDETLDRRVAVKVIAPHLAEDAEFRDRFAAEARSLAALDSPHVVHVYAHGDQAGRLYIATQLIPDGDLAHWIEDVGAPPLRVGLDLISQVAAGLADAHAVGLVHRDIKPANVLLRRLDDAMSAYLGDFGVACRVGAEHALQEVGTIGTPLWMAPELHSGTPAGVASDVYSLGCLLWATLTGRPPYAGTTEDRIVAAHCEQPVPQLVGASLMAREVNRILRTAMAKDPAARYRSATELRDDLRRAATLPHKVGRDVAATTTSHRSSLVGAALLLVVVAGSITRATPGDVAAPGPSSAASTGDEARAVASLARALAGPGVMTRAEAGCTARRWIAGAGLRSMVAAGYFDADLEYVDQDRSAMTSRIEAAATAAARACAQPD
ncbi:MAG: serine/threonine-protein kinase [Nocardioides sp.]